MLCFFCELKTGCSDGGRFAVNIFVLNHTVNSFGITVLQVKGEFIKNIEADQQKANYAKGEACNVEGRVQFVSPEISPSGFYITFYHSVISYLLIFCCWFNDPWPEQKQHVNDK